MLDVLLISYIGFFTVVPTILFFGLFLMLLGTGIYYGLSQIISYKQLAYVLANAHSSIKKRLHDFHLPDSWHTRH